MNTSTTPTKKARATISDVARKSGVAKATVSKALDTTSRYGLSEDVRRRVAEAAQQLGYQPGGRGRVVAGEQTRTVGLFYSRSTPIPSEVYERLITAASEALLARNCRLIHLPLVGEPQTWKNLLEDRRVAGGLVIDPLDRDVEGLLRGNTLRCVLLNVASPMAVAQVIPDLVAGATAMTRHLLDLGHRRIALCGGGGARSENANLRTEGFKSAMRQAGFEAGASIVKDPQQFIEQWTRGRTQPTAIVADSLATAVDLLHSCWKKGVRVPQDLSLATLEDAQLAEKLTPPLTAMRCPAEQLGSEAANLLVDQIEGEQSALPRKILILESLVVRQSTGPARSD